MNRLKKIILGTLALGAILGGIAVAQTISIPQVQVIHPTDLMQVVPYGQPSTGNVYATPAQITSQSGYYKSTPATGFTFTVGNSQSYVTFLNSGSVNGTVTLAAAPSDGDNVCLFSQGGVGTLTLNANTGQSINNAITAMTAATRYCYLYSASNLTWDRN